MTERYDCHYCKESLFGKKYVLREENPYCVKCYESLYSNTCEECKKPIGCNTRVGDQNTLCTYKHTLCGSLTCKQIDIDVRLYTGSVLQRPSLA